MNVILSIKPEYCEKIRTGDKRYEFRKVVFNKRENIDKVFIYCTSPVKKIIGFFKIDEIIEDEPYNLWINYRDKAGVSKDQFFKYFKDTNVGYAIKILDTEFFEPLDPREINPKFTPPQSFCYLDNENPFMRVLSSLRRIEGAVNFRRMSKIEAV